MPSDNREAHRQSLIIYNEFSALLSQWPNLFTISVDDKEVAETDHFEVVVAHFGYGLAQTILARLAPSGRVEITNGPEYWEDLDRGSLFALLWFGLAASTYCVRTGWEYLRPSR